MHLLLVFCHFLAASLALGAIVATDLRLLSKLAQDRVRIAPPNVFVTRIVAVSLAILYLTGALLVVQGALERPGYLANPKLHAKVALVLLLTVNAVVLHRITFPRLGRGRRIARWKALDWVAVALPVAASNALWLFVAFLGIARAWNDTMPASAIFGAAAIAYVVVQAAILGILVIAGRPIDPRRPRWSDVVRRMLAAVGELGAPPKALDGIAPRRRHDDPTHDEGETTATRMQVHFREQSGMRRQPIDAAPSDVAALSGERRRRVVSHATSRACEAVAELGV